MSRRSVELAFEHGAARKAFGFEPAVAMDQGLPEYICWARTEVGS